MRESCWAKLPFYDETVGSKLGYGGWQYQHYGYQVKEHQKTISPVLVSVQYDTPEHSY